MDEFGHTAANAPMTLLEHVGEEEDIGIEEPAKVLRGRWHAVADKALADEGGIRAPSEADAAGGVAEIEYQRKSALEGFDPRTAGADEGAIDIKKDESDHSAILLSRGQLFPGLVEPAALGGVKELGIDGVLERP